MQPESCGADMPTDRQEAAGLEAVPPLSVKQCRLTELATFMSGYFTVRGDGGVDVLLPSGRWLRLRANEVAPLRLALDRFVARGRGTPTCHGVTVDKVLAIRHGGRIAVPRGR